MSTDFERADDELDLESTTEKERLRIENLQKDFIANRIRVQISTGTFVYMNEEQYAEFKNANNN